MTSTVVTHWSMIIGGERVDAAESLEIRDPSTEELVATVACGSADDVDRAVEAAQKAFDAGDWSRASGVHRADVLRRMSTILGERLEEIVELEISGNGATEIGRAHV